MKRRSYITLCSALLLFGGASVLSAQDAEKEVALVTAVSGQATLVNAQGDQPVKLGMRPLLGDELAADGGNISLVFLSGDFVSIKDGERLKLGATLKESSLATGSGTRGLGEDDATPVAQNGVGRGRRGRVWQAQLASVSGIRGDGMPIAVAPRLAVAGENPRFYWFDTDTSGEAGERGYLIVVKNEENTVIARQQVRGTAGRLNSFRFERPPQGLAATARMHYQWTILPDGAAVPEGQLDAGFVFIDQTGMDEARGQMQRLDELREKGRIDETSYHMLQCSLLLDERERLFSDGLPHLLALAATPDGEEYAGEQIARLFLRFGNQVSALAPMFLHRPGAYISK